jgi:uncharacterized lipoprotein YbaY
MHKVPLVKGKITFEKTARPFTGATMYVRLEKITAADMASEVVADYVERDVTFDPKAPRDVSFAIAGDPPDPRTSYAVRAHIDIDGDGEVSQDDFVSMQNYPVITFGYPREVSILVRQVK